MSEQSQAKSFWIGFPVLGVAFLIMLAAKVFGYAPDLSWWLVFAPVLLSAGAAALIVTCSLGIALLVAVVSVLKGR